MSSDTSSDAIEQNRDDLYKRARIAWGTDAQLAKAAEEFSELAAEVNRMQNNQADDAALLEEIADARLMLEQLETMFTDDALEGEFQTAVATLRDRVDSAQEGDA